MSTADSEPPVGATAAQHAYIDGLRDLADFLEAHPDLIGTSEYFSRYAVDRDQLVAMTRGAGGRWKKEGTDDHFRLVRSFGPHRFSVWTERPNVCERVVIGTETVEVPDPAAMEDVPLVTIERDVVEWRCPPSLLAEISS